MICKDILLIIFLSESKLFLYTIKWFQIFLYNNHSLTLVICLHKKFVIFNLHTNPGQSWFGSNDNEEELGTPEISNASALPSDCLMSYSGNLFIGVLTSL